MLPAAWRLSEVVLPPPRVTIGGPASTSSHPRYVLSNLKYQTGSQHQGGQWGNALQSLKQWIANGKLYKAGELIYSQYGYTELDFQHICFHTIFSVIHRLINEKYGKAPIGKGQNIKSLEVPNRIISGLWRDSSQRVVTNCTYNLHHFLT